MYPYWEFDREIMYSRENEEGWLENINEDEYSGEYSDLNSDSIGNESRV